MASEMKTPHDSLYDISYFMMLFGLIEMEDWDISEMIRFGNEAIIKRAREDLCLINK